MITNYPPHLKTFSYVGFHRYSLTFCTNGRRRIFTDSAIVSLVLQQIVRAAKEQRFAVIAYCFMPDHLHLLVKAESDSSDCRRFIKSFKQLSGYYFAQRRKDTLWQRYGFERVLRDDEATLEVARYIVNNPVRAGLAPAVEMYPFVGSLMYELKDLVQSTSA